MLQGLSDDARKRVWPFLLRVFPWTSTSQERSYMRVAMKVQYAGLRSRWMDDEDVKQSERFYEEAHRIEIDCLRTDRTHPMFESSDLDPSEPGAAHSSSNPNIKAMQEILLTWVFGGDAIAPTISSERYSKAVVAIGRIDSDDGRRNLGSSWFVISFSRTW